MIIFFILTTLMCDSGVILKGEIRCSSLFGLKGLNDWLKYRPLLCSVAKWPIQLKLISVSLT